jgi:hypothetical protein
VKWYEKYGRKASRIVKRYEKYGKYGRKVWVVLQNNEYCL